MKLLLLIPVILLAGCATVKPPPEDITLTPELAAKCQAEGGGTLFSAQRFAREMEGAFMAGARAAQERRGQGL